MRTSNGKWQRIVGVIGDTRYNGPAKPIDAEIYNPYTQDSVLQFVALRTAIPEEAVIGAVRKVIRGVDPGLPITQVRTMRESVDLATELPRQMMALVAGFAAITLGMATLGLGGVMAYTVSRRKREIGLRMALGASRSAVVWQSGSSAYRSSRSGPRPRGFAPAHMSRLIHFKSAWPAGSATRTSGPTA